MQLIIGDKNLSSWSMRAWLAAKSSGLPFEEVLIPLDRPDTKAKIAKFSPSEKVPCLIDGPIQIWDSLAIGEYLAERAPAARLWPAAPADRARARAYAAEMHSGFSSLRDQLSMDIRLRIEVRHLTPGTIRDVQRILQIWSECLKSSPGPFLFGDFGIVDAFYAPVVFRFLSYGVRVESKEIQGYMKAVESQPFVKSWVQAALDERYESLVFQI